MNKIGEEAAMYMAFDAAIDGTKEAENNGAATKNNFKFDNQQIKTKAKAVRKYKCGLCDKAYTQSNNLKLHIKYIHEGLKPQHKYKCDMCDKAYTQAHSLKSHVQSVHKGLKPQYKCEQCDKTFTQSHSLKSHVQSVHNNTAATFEQQQQRNQQNQQKTIPNISYNNAHTISLEASRISESKEGHIPLAYASSSLYHHFQPH